MKRKTQKELQQTQEIQPSHQKVKTLDKILICLAVFLLTFIVAMVIIFCVKDAIPDTLVACVLSGSGIELIVAAWIQTTKEKNKNSDLVEEEGEEDETSR